MLPESSARGHRRVLFRQLVRGDRLFTVVARKVAIDPPTIELPSAWDGGEFSLRVPTVSGRVYSLEYKDRLDEPAWIRIDEVTGDGTERVLMDPEPPSATRFCRLRVD